MPTPLELTYFQQEDVLFLGRDLLGKILVTEFDNQITAGRIVETEAYAGIEDKASHAYGGRRTKRNRSMYLPGGHAYVHMCYGIHVLFNVVTNRSDIPQGILIRAIEPLIGIDLMLQRRGLSRLKRNVAGGPGRVCQALGLTMDHDGLPLCDVIRILDDGACVESIATPRIGVEYAESCAAYPWRFRVKESLWTSPAH